MDRETIEALAHEIRSGNRRALARAITMVESRRQDHREAAETLLEILADRTGHSIRLGISGVPGVGKSTFIEAFGQHLTQLGHRVAVLAVDPSSKISGGSILGDKTRMEKLARNPDAFIRPSPAGETLGGVARRTREAMMLCEAAGFDVVIVETVGVGQSETTVAEMTDMFLLLLLPGGGDELQGLKKGIVEIADAILVNKADGAMKDVARRSAAEYHGAVRLLGGHDPDWSVPVETCSALTGEGLPGIWTTVRAFRDAREASGRFFARRAEQNRAWLWSEIEDRLIRAFRNDPRIKAGLPDIEASVTNGPTPPPKAARALVEQFLKTAGKDDI